MAGLGEARVVREIMLAAYAEYEGSLPVASGAHVETVADVLDAMRQGGAVLAVDGERPVGSARFAREPEHLYVGRLAVLPSHRRRGVASAIMNFLEGIAPSLGLNSIRIGVRESLPSNIALYRSLGYEVLDVSPHPRGADRVWAMVKHIAR